ncbi:hypothetical protein OIU84_020036 [Salix udensis]|uniref:Uncharacterized protein n=1 Tax=Salix udensis TaxID=889485 RepID=A0AAD6L0A5_9ROSI|nr:hypothetical protein OIU84_020036 [Salix udensis]
MTAKKMAQAHRKRWKKLNQTDMEAHYRPLQYMGHEPSSDKVGRPQGNGGGGGGGGGGGAESGAKTGLL